MKQPMTYLRIYFLIYCCLIFPFFYLNLPIHFLFIDSILAYVPIELFFLYQKNSKHNSALIVAFFYLIFLPNNLYLMTDLIHLNRINFYPLTSGIMTEKSIVWVMFTLLVIGILSLLMIGFKTEFVMLDKLRNTYQWSSIWVFIWYFLGFIVLSTGVFLGRFLRLNSIDLITEPSKIINTLGGLFSVKALIFIILFSIIQAVAYGTFKLSQALFK